MHHSILEGLSVHATSFKMIPAPYKSRLVLLSSNVKVPQPIMSFPWNSLNLLGQGFLVVPRLGCSCRCAYSSLSSSSSIFMGQHNRRKNGLSKSQLLFSTTPPTIYHANNDHFNKTLSSQSTSEHPLDDNDSNFDKFNSSNNNKKSHDLDEIATLDNPIMSHPETYDPIKTQQNILKAAQWNQGTGSQGKWNPKFCHQAVTAYIHHLQYLLSLKNTSHPPSEQETDSIDHLPLPLLQRAKQTLLSSHTTERALKAMIKMNLDTHHLSKSVRNLERLIGNIGMTPLTDRLSLRLLEANGKAGNIGRTISLLKLRKVKGYTPIPKEFHYAIQSIVSAGLYLRKNRNVFLREDQQPEIDNPTRWLDAILVNMNDRGVELDTKMANQMLDCYCSTGRSGKALHFFYKISREYVDNVNDDDGKNVTVTLDEMKDARDSFGAAVVEDDIPRDIKSQMPVFQNRKAKVRMKMRQHMPPYYKLPSEIKLNGDLVKRPNREELISRLKWEKEKDFSLSLTAAFAFADSLTHGACGHGPIQLDLTSWNILIKACCYRGALWRAMEILNDTLPKNGIQPDTFSYNTILAGLARVGDKDFMRDMLTTMTNSNIALDKYTIQALVDGYLNAGDISGAVTLVQDMFNQHHILPPYTTHLKIIEFALGNELIYEAKRQVYFLQQIWKYSPKQSDSKEFQRIMFLTQKNPKLSKSSLQRLFAYFGEELTDEDFF